MKKGFIVVGAIWAYGAGMAAQYTMEKLISPKIDEIIYNDDDMSTTKAVTLGAGVGAISGTVGLIVTSMLLSTIDSLIIEK